MAWYNSSWQYRVKVTVLASKVDADLTDYPVYVNLANLPAGFHSHVKSDGGDIRVTKTDGTTEVPRDVVFYDSATDTGELHFKTSGTLSGTTDTDFYIYYGNASASDYAVTDTYGRNNVWTNGYEAVFHLHEGGTTTSGAYKDSSGNYTSGATGYGNVATNSSAQIGTGTTFDGTGDYIDIGTNTILGTAAFTLSAWINTDTVTKYSGAVSIGATGTANSAYIGTVATAQVGTSNSIGGGFYGSNYGSGVTTIGSWKYLVMTFAGGTGGAAKIYVSSGTPSVSTTYTPGIDSNYTRIGRITSDTVYDFDGSVDEVRISSVERASTWISTEYNNQSSPSTFYSVGSEETASSGSSVLPTPDNLKTMDYAYQAQPFVDVPSKSAVDIKTMDYAYKGQPFVRNYATGATSISENRNARIKGFDTTSNFRSTRIKGESTVNDNRSSRIKGVGTSFDQKDARIIGKDIAISDRSAKTTGTEIINSLRSSRIKGVDTVFDSKSARIIGYLSTSESRNTRVIGKETVSDNRNAKTKGIDTVFSSRNARVVGAMIANDNRNTRTLGKDIENSSRGSRINGVDTTSSNRSARVIGLEIAQDSRNSFIKGVSGASDGRDARIKGSERTSDTRVARIKGLEVITDGREAKIFGRETANDSRSARVKGFFTTENNRNARIKGFDTLGNSRNAKIYGIYIVQDSRSARTKGYEMVHWTPEKRIPVGVEAPVSHSQTIEWTPEKRLPVGTEAPVLHSQTVEWEPEKKVPSGRSN